MLVAVGDLITSLLAGLVVFSMLGFMSHSLNKPLADVVSAGFGIKSHS